MQSGETYGALTLKYKEDVFWICKCACGNQRVVARTSNLIHDFYPECGKCRRLGTNTVLKAQLYREKQLKRKASIKANQTYYISETSYGKVKSTKGETEIYTLLKAYNIPFDTEKDFGVCYPGSDKPFRFDFFVNGKYVIEFDGIQHFKPVDRYGGEKSFHIQQWRDKYKNEFCLKNNIPIIRIPYTKIGKIMLKDLKPETSEFLVYKVDKN